MIRSARAEDGCRIAYSVEGEGAPLLLIAGLGGLGAFWSAAARYLTGFRVVTFDHRGCGGSDRAASGYSISRMARDALAVLDDAGIRRAHIVGHSTGGAIAQVIAAENDDRVDRLVLSGTWERPDARFRMIFESRLEVLERAGPATYQKLTHVLGYTPQWIDAHQPELDAAVERAGQALEPVSIAADRIRMLLNWNGLADLRQILAPTLVVAARDDLLIPFHHAEVLADRIAGARLATASGGHFYPRTDPQGFAALIAPHLHGGSDA